MDIISTLTPVEIDELKCSVCSNYLSHFPIRTTPNAQHVCGRCPASPTTHTRNQIYEIISQNMLFPCRYYSEGCCEMLTPKCIPQHEEQCFFKISECVTREFTGCNVQVSHLNMTKHCHEEHSEYFLEDSEFEIDVTETGKYDHLLEYDDEILTLRSEFQPEETVFMFVWSHSVNYKLKFTSGLKSVSVKCDSDDEETTGRISLGLLIGPRKTNIAVRIHLRASEVCSMTKADIKRELSNLWRCSSCLRYVVPLDLSDNRCPKCQNGFYPEDGTVYSTINGMVNLGTFPCGNSANGCEFTGQLSQITNHQEFCEFGSQTCPLCRFSTSVWSGLGKDLESHFIQDHHGSKIVNSSFTTIRVFTLSLRHHSTLYSSRAITWCIMKYSHYLFDVTLFFKDEKCYWIVQMIGEFKDIFDYEMEISDGQGTVPRISVTQACSKQSSEEELLNNLRKYYYISLDQAEDFCNERGRISVKVRIFKKCG